MDENQIPEQTQEENSLKKQFTTVTPLSKYIALALLVVLPFIGFWFGIQYADIQNVNKTVQTEVKKNEQNILPQNNKVEDSLNEKSKNSVNQAESLDQETSENESDNQSDLTEMLKQLGNFPQQSCPTPTDRYHTEKYVYVRANAEGVSILRYPGSSIDTVRLMTEKVQENMSMLQSNTLIEVFFYEVFVFSPISGAYSQENDTIQCFNLAS